MCTPDWSTALRVLFVKLNRARKVNAINRRLKFYFGVESIDVKKDLSVSIYEGTWDRCPGQQLLDVGL
jgi:hypothetical protein